MDDLKETKLTSELKYTGRVISVEDWKVRLPDGGTASRDVVVHKGACAIVAVDEKQNVYMVQQYRTPVEKLLWEIPAGKLDTINEDPLLCAQRELEEETGLHASSMELLTTIYTSPGFCNERIHIFLAQGLTKHEAHTDEDEFLQVALMPINKLIDAIMKGEIRDSKTISGVLMAANKLNLLK